MKQSKIMPVLKHYQKLMGKYGDHDVRALNWSSEESQFHRFLILTQIGNLDFCSVLDAGCGFGDFVPHLRNRFPNMIYTGLDLNPEFVAVCKERYPTEEFIQGNLLEPLIDSYDYVLASGTFGYAIEDYRNQYFECIRNLFNACHKGVAINLLNARGHDPDPLYATFDPIDVHLFAMELTNRFILRQDYYDHDMTLYLYK